MPRPGFSLIELIIAIAVAAIIIVAATALFARSFTISRYQFEQARITDEARIESQRMQEEIRNARPLDCDGDGTAERAWLIDAGEYRLALYTNADSDDEAESVTYELTNTDLKRQVTESPCDSAPTVMPEQVLTRFIRNGEQGRPLFSFFPTGIADTTPALPLPLADPLPVARVKIDLLVDVDPAQEPGAAQVSTDVTPRVGMFAGPAVSPGASPSIPPVTVTCTASPAQAQRGENVTLSLSGATTYEVSQVVFPDSQPATFNGHNPVYALVPETAALGTGDITVSLTADGQPATAVCAFQVQNAPLITCDISPAFGPIGTNVTFTGSAVSNIKQATFSNGKTVTVSPPGSDPLTVAVPAGAVTGTTSVTTVSNVTHQCPSFTVETLPPVDPPTPCSNGVDVAFAFDITGSMGAYVNAVADAFNQIAGEIERVSNNDYRLALVTFGDRVFIRTPFAANNRAAFSAALRQAPEDWGHGIPEASDEALNAIINNLPARPNNNAYVHPNGQDKPFGGPFRSDKAKILILATDAVPGGFNDQYELIDKTNAHTRAIEARTQGIKIAAIHVSSWNDPRQIMQDYATTTGGLYFRTYTGSDFVQNVVDVINSCGSSSSSSYSCTPCLPGSTCTPILVNAVVNQDVTLTTPGGASMSWTAIGGTPNSGIGANFTTQYSTPSGSYYTIYARGSGGSGIAMECARVTIAPTLSCSPKTGTTAIGHYYTFYSNKGGAQTCWKLPGSDLDPYYNWSTECSPGGGNIDGTGFGHTIRQYSSPGTYTATVTLGGETDTCSLTVSDSPSASELIIDDSDGPPKFYTTGNNWYSFGFGGYDNSHIRFDGTTSGNAYWTFNLPSNMQYKVYARWRSYSSVPQNISFKKLRRANGSEYSVNVDCSQAPRSDYTYGSYGWQYLGDTFSKSTAGSWQLQTSIPSGKWCGLDAVLLQPVGLTASVGDGSGGLAGWMSRSLKAMAWWR